MANQIVKLKKGSDYLYPYADYIGIDASNVLARNVSSYTATQDCYVCGYSKSWKTIKINNITIVQSAVSTNMYANFPICYPLKKGQIVDNDSGSTLIVFGIKY